MNLYLIEQYARNGCDTTDSAVVSAKTEDNARLVHPDGEDFNYIYTTWCKSPNDVKVTLLGTYNKNVSEVILKSFNAG